MSLTCFKSYDIRGRLGDELNEDIAYRIGRAYAQSLKPKTVVVGGDNRLSTNSLKNALSEGLCDEQVDVIDIGLSGTEEIYFATTYLQVDGGIEITASHNPKDFNGMKLVRENSKPISNDSGLLDIKKLTEENCFSTVDENKRGSLVSQNILEPYTQHLLSYVDTSQLKPLKIVVNAGNGSAGHVIDVLEKSLPFEFIKLNHQPDGHFPKGIPNPLLVENRAETRQAVLDNHADLGIAWDGDFDRCFFFDEQGEFVEGYYIVGLLAEAFLLKNQGAKIVHDPRLVWNTQDVVRKSSGQAIQSKTGHAFIKERMRLEDAVYGGEMSAHHYFRDFFYCDSGMIPWLLVTELLCQKNQSLSQLLNHYINAFPASGEINFTIANPKLALEKILSYYQKDVKSIDKTDGISLEFDQWRFNLRSSNTEPLVRLNIETRGDKQLVKQKLHEIENILNTL
jgi:phosphomannomutase